AARPFGTRWSIGATRSSPARPPSPRSRAVTRNGRTFSRRPAKLEARERRAGEPVVPARLPAKTPMLGPPTAHPPRPRTLTVSLFGDGDFGSIAAAVRAVPAGSLILVQPGVYAENLALEGTVEIRGPGAAETVLESDLGPCLEVLAGQPAVRGLTLRG